MSPDQKRQVQSSFRLLVPFERAAELFYGRLFKLNPELRCLFKDDMEEQGRTLMHALAAIMVSLDWTDDCTPALQELGARHAAYGMKSEDYEVFGAALMWMLKTMLGEAFTPQLQAAWQQVYTALSSTMIAAAPLPRVACFAHITNAT